MTPAPYRRTKAGVELFVRLQPGSSADRIDGIYRPDGATTSLKVKVRAQPEKGKANKALIKLLAKTLGVAQGGLVLTAGTTHRSKTVLIPDADGADDTVRRLDELLRCLGGDNGND